MRVLVIEDERKLARLLREGLSRHGFAVDTCGDYNDGLASVLATDYDLLLLDRLLPGNKDGMELCRELRKAGVRTPVLMLTAKDQVQERIEGLNSGADDYLTKPFAFSELLARCQALLRRGRATTGTVLLAGDLQMDTTRRTVQRAGQPITLTAKEYAILEYLLRSKGMVVSKQQIIDHAWDFDAEVLPSTVEVFMVYLRSKVDRPFATPLIKTVRGFGYTIADDEDTHRA